MKDIYRLLPIIFIVMIVNLYGSITGKISGRVIDAETGESLIGVNIMLEGTALGAATDENGYFVILNVPPATYTLKVKMIGYEEVTIKNVQVKIDLTTEINVQLRRETLELEGIVVEAKRPVVVKDISHSQLNVEAEKMESMPVVEVTEVVGLQAGIEGLSIRGGTASQTAFIVDGFVLNDERSNDPYTSVSLGTVKEVQVQTGGFNAEYGNIRSGVINVITKEGGREEYSGFFNIVYRPPGKKHFGPSLYDPDSYFLRPYLDPEVCWFGTSAWDDYTRRQYPSFEGWVNISDVRLGDQDPSNDLTPAGAKRLFEWQHRRQGDIKKPDYVLDLAFGGPVPYIGEKLGNLRFYASYRDLREMFIVPTSRDSYKDNIARLKLTSDISENTKLVIDGMYGEIHSFSPYNWMTTPTGTVLRSDYSVANYVTSEVLFVPGHYSPTSIYRTIVGAKLNRVLTSKSFYEMSVQHRINRYKAYQIEDRDTSRVYDIFPGEPEYFADEAPYGYWGETGIDAIGDKIRIGGWMNLGRDNSVISTTSFRFDYTNQINIFSQLKTGIEVVYNNYDIKSFTSHPTMDTWNREQVYEVNPYRIGAYLQDKLEFEGFIANIGLRLDFSDPNCDYYDLDPFSEYYKAGKGKLIEEEAPKKKAEPQIGISPRLGISHPITENSKLYFNYGHFYSEPASTYRFRIQREYNGSVTSIGSPNLEQEKTVAYELGYSQNLFNRFLLNLAAYYKDVTDQIGWVDYENVNASVRYSIPNNCHYEDIRGFEITLDKRTGKWITGFINYTYMVNTYGYFYLLEYYEDPNKQREYLRQNPYQEKPRPSPYFRANIDLHTPINFGPSLVNIYPVGGWNVNFLITWKAGSYATYNPQNIPGIINNVRWKDTHFTDMRISKTMKAEKFEMRFFVDVSNLFNNKYLSSTGFSDNIDYIDYMESLNFDWEEGVEHGSDRVGEYRPVGVEYDPLEPNPDNDPEIAARNAERKEKKSYIDMPNIKGLTFLNPRYIEFGIRVAF